jgi:hypothetical protein
MPLPKICTIQDFGVMLRDQILFPKGITLENVNGAAIQPIDGQTFRLHFVIRFPVAQKAMGATLTLCPTEHTPERLLRIVKDRLKDLASITYDEAAPVIEQGELMARRMEAAKIAQDEYRHLKEGAMVPN